MAYPFTYSTDNDLFGDVVDQFIITLMSDIGASDTALSVDSADVNTPCFALIENELVFVASSNPGGKTLTVQRGYGGTTASPHSKNTPIYIVIASYHFEKLRDGIIGVQKYPGLVGLDSGKPSNPPVGAVYVATDTKRVYIATSSGSWVSVFKLGNHSEYPEAGDPHPQYHTAQRFLDWHNAQSGGHVTGGDNHDHSAGSGIARIRSGLDANKGTVTGSGWVYYATDTGYFYIANNNNWVRVAGAPSGMIAMFLATDLNGECPPGWVRFTALDGRFPRGAPSGVTQPLGTGGSLSHSHTYTDIPAHYHVVPSTQATTSTDGNHNHSIPARTSPYGSGVEYTSNVNTTQSYTDYGGDHSHTGTLPSVTSGGAVRASDNSAGTSQGTTSTDTALPPYRRVIFCQKV